MKALVSLLALALVAVGCSAGNPDPEPGSEAGKSYEEVAAQVVQECQADPDCMALCDSRPGIEVYCEKGCLNHCDAEVNGACYAECSTVSVNGRVVDEECFEGCLDFELIECQSVCLYHCEGDVTWVTHEEWTETRKLDRAAL